MTRKAAEAVRRQAEGAEEAWQWKSVQEIRLLLATERERLEEAAKQKAAAAAHGRAPCKSSQKTSSDLPRMSWASSVDRPWQQRLPTRRRHVLLPCPRQKYARPSRRKCEWSKASVTSTRSACAALRQVSEVGTTADRKTAAVPLTAPKIFKSSSCGIESSRAAPPSQN